jgi:hypothetical protein
VKSSKKSEKRFTMSATKETFLPFYEDRRITGLCPGEME